MEEDIKQDQQKAVERYKNNRATAQYQLSQ